MDLNFGINGSLGVDAARPISISSSTPIGFLGVAADKEELYGIKLYNNADAALTFCEDNSIEGDIVAGLKGIRLAHVNCPIILNLTDTAGALEASELFKKAEAYTGVNLENGLIIAPAISAGLPLAAKLDAIGAATQATALIDCFVDTEADAKEFIKNFGTRDSLICRGRYDADGEKIPASALIAGTIAYYDADTPFGWAKSHSNRVVHGISGCDNPPEYLDGSDCEARRMRQAGFATIVRDVGWRTYGFETTHIDTIWQSLDRVRTFYRLLTAIKKAAKFARDREASILLQVRDTVIEFMNELKGNDVVIGFDVFFDPKKNTKATVTAGKFYLTIKAGDMPSVRELNIELIYTDDYNGLLIKYINGEDE